MSSNEIPETKFHVVERFENDQITQNISPTSPLITFPESSVENRWTRRPIVVDAFLFFNELDILELRLEELHTVVDYFLLVECGETFSGVTKPFLYDENKDRFSSYLDKIWHVKLPGLPLLLDDTEEGRFRLEQFQRDALMLGLIGRKLKDDDIILISDVDEIPQSKSVAEISKYLTNRDIALFKQRYFKLFLDVELPPETEDWLGTVAVRYGVLTQTTPHALRVGNYGARFYDPSFEIISDGKTLRRRFIQNGGWHLTYFGGAEAVRYKTANYAHGARIAPGAALSTPVASIVRGRSEGLRPFTNNLKIELQAKIRHLDKNVPGPILDNLSKYYHLFQCSYDSSNKNMLPQLQQKGTNTPSPILEHNSAAISEGENWTEQWIKALYRIFLMREADQNGLTSHLQSIENHKITPEQLIRAFLRSNEFLDKSENFISAHISIPLKSILLAETDTLKYSKIMAEPRPIINHVISVGTHCYTSWLLERMGVRKYALPLDYIFSDLEMTSECISDNFKAFLDSSQYEIIDTEGRCGHKIYSDKYKLPIIFNHHNVTQTVYYNHFARAVARFQKILSSEGQKLFLCVSSTDRTNDDKIRILSDVISEKCEDSELVVVMVFGPRLRRELKFSRRIGIAKVYDFFPQTEMVKGLSFEDDQDNAEIEILFSNYLFEITEIDYSDLINRENP